MGKGDIGELSKFIKRKVLQAPDFFFGPVYAFAWFVLMDNYKL